MLSDGKWIGYAFRILGAVAGGANSISSIAERVGGSESYLAKVVAVLRRAGLISTTYELSRSLDQIEARQIVKLADQSPIDDPIHNHLAGLMLAGLTVSVKQVLESNEVEKTKM